MDKSGDVDGAVNEEQASRWIFKIPGIGDGLKYTGVVAAGIYAVLFLGYRKYYTLLGVRPEDVGINSTFILVRSIGYIVLFALFIGLAILLTLWFNRIMKMLNQRRKAIHILRMCAFGLISLGILYVFDYPDTGLAVILGPALAVACFAMARFSYKSRRDTIITLAGLVVAAVTIFVVPPSLAIVSAYARAFSVLRGHPTGPWTVLGMPLLDVSAEEVQVIWICPDAQRPPLFKQSQASQIGIGILVGETSTSYYIRWGNQSQPFEIVKLPQSCAVLTTRA